MRGIVEVYVQLLWLQCKIFYINFFFFYKAGIKSAIGPKWAAPLEFFPVCSQLRVRSIDPIPK